MTGPDFMMVFGLALGVTVLLGMLGAGLVSFSYYVVAFSANVGILEESYKVGLTNLLVMPLEKAFGKRRSGRLDKSILCIVGSAIVAFWAWTHTHYSIGLVVVTFLVGITYFLLIIWKGNYLPIILVHSLYDLIVFSIRFP